MKRFLSLLITHLFENRLPYAIKQDVLEYLENEKINVKNESEIFADYFYNNENWYTVSCIIKDRKETLVDIKFDVPTKSQAETICNNWRSKSSSIYPLFPVLILLKRGLFLSRFLN